MNYTLHQLQVFLKITQTQSITKAAEELFLTQPAVSIQLKNFQKQFDVPLTEVIGRKLYVTEFGWEIAETAERIMNDVYAINYKTLAYKGMLTGVLRISAVSTGKYVMPYFLSEFMGKHSGVELKMDVTNRSKVLESLEKNEVDFALVSILPEDVRVERVELMKNKLFLVGKKESKWKKGKEKREDWQEQPLIFREEGSGTRRTMESFLQKKNIQLRKKMVLTSNEALKQAVIAGLGNSIMPLIGLRNELQNNDLEILPVIGLPINTTWNLVWLKGKAFTSIAEAYLNFLKTHKKRIIDQYFDWYEGY